MGKNNWFVNLDTSKVFFGFGLICFNVSLCIALASVFYFNRVHNGFKLVDYTSSSSSKVLSVTEQLYLHPGQEITINPSKKFKSLTIDTNPTLLDVGYTMVCSDGNIYYSTGEELSIQLSEMVLRCRIIDITSYVPLNFSYISDGWYDDFNMTTSWIDNASYADAIMSSSAWSAIFVFFVLGVVVICISLFPNN